MLRQSSINLIGGLLPAFASLACIPLILSKHGSEFFGIYSLQTALLMVVGLMDLGLSRGIMLVTYDANLNPTGTPNKPFKAGLKLTYWIALIILTATILLIFLMEYLSPSKLDIKISLVLNCLSGAITILTLPLRSLLEIKGKFGVLNIIRSALACSIPVAPLFPGTEGDYPLLISAIYVLIFRIGGLYAYRKTCRIRDLALEQLPNETIEWQRGFIKRCGWVGLTNVGSIILTYADRIILAGLVSATALASFVIAHELATKIWMVTGAILSAIMPRVAAEFMNEKSKCISFEKPKISLFNVRILIFGSVILPSALLAVFLNEALTLWLGSE